MTPLLNPKPDRRLTVLLEAAAKNCPKADENEPILQTIDAICGSLELALSLGLEGDWNWKRTLETVAEALTALRKLRWKIYRGYQATGKVNL